MKAAPCLSEGQHVSVGQKIANPSNEHSVAVFASISGIVTRIGKSVLPSGAEGSVVEINSDKAEKILPEIGQERKSWQDLSRESLMNIFQASGLVEMGPSMEALHSKINDGAQLVIINACESEPYVTADYALIMSHPLEVLKGAEILKKACGAKAVVVATETNKMEAAELLKSKIYFLKWNHYAVETLPVFYPQDIDCLLAHEMLKRKPSGLSTADKSQTLVFSPATAFAAYEAVVLQKPLYERAVTVGGECVFEPKTVWTRIGTSVAEVFLACKGFMRQPGKIVLGGPMRGIVPPTREVPVLAGTNAILALPEDVVRQGTEKPCIRCGRCIEACPVEISPAMISQAAEKELFDLAVSYGAESCIECGNCTYICPSKRPMAALLHEALTYSAGIMAGQRKAGVTPDSHAVASLKKYFRKTGSSTLVNS
jgi:electron transport complex protein RnfC